MTTSPLDRLKLRRQTRELVEVTEQFAILLRAGETLDSALEVLTATAPETLRDTLLDLRRGVREGRPLSDAMQAHELFSEFYVSVIRIGESRGDLAGALARLASHLERQHELKERVRSALIYPAILIAMTGISLIVLLTFVLPQFKSLFDSVGASLPWFTQGLLVLGERLHRHALLIAVLIAALLLLWRWQMRRLDNQYRLHRFVMRVPLVSDLVQRLNVARFSRSLATMLDGGAPILEALRLSQTSMPNRYLRQSLSAVIDTIKQGGRLADGLRSHARFPVLATRMIHVGEESGELARSLDYVAEVYDRQVDTAVRRLVAVLEPLLIITIGLVIALVIYAIVSAISELNNLPL